MIENCEVFEIDSHRPESQTLITFIVTCYSLDRLFDVIELIESISSQPYGSSEIVLVVERNQRLFQKLVSHYDDDHSVHLKLVHCSTPLGLSLARNLGLRFAAGKIIAFVDDDVTLQPGWITETHRTYQADGQIIGISGRAIPVLMDETLNWFPRQLHWLIGSTEYAHVETIVEVRNAHGMNMSFKREVFDMGLRFRESTGMRSRDKQAHSKFPSEDVDLSIRARFATGGKIVYNPRVCVRHKLAADKMTLRHMFSRAFFVGRQRRMIRLSYGNLEDDALKPEKTLLRRLPRGILMGTFNGWLRRPSWTIRRICFTTVVLCLVALGYVTCIPQEWNDAKA